MRPLPFAIALLVPALVLASPFGVDAKGGGRGGKSSVSKSSGSTSSSSSSVHVRGYTRKDGTYVQPHRRSAPDGRKSNNWSTRGNVNPYTGKPGTQSP
jgi:hypothetical protein